MSLTALISSRHHAASVMSLTAVISSRHQACITTRLWFMLKRQTAQRRCYSVLCRKFLGQQDQLLKLSPNKLWPLLKRLPFSSFLPALSAKRLSPRQSCGTGALQPRCECLTGSVGARGREEAQHLCTLGPFTMTFVADGACLVVLVKSC